MEQSNDLVRLIQIIYKWRKPLIVVTVIVGIASSVFTWFFMPDYFKSTVNFYPSNPIMTDRQVLFSNSSGEIEIDYFGSAGDVDRILTIANTSGIIDYIINKYKLMEHYGYDSTKEMARYNTKKEFLSNYSSIETEYGAIEISVWDQDKNLASDMANHIVETIDNHNKSMLLRDKKLVVETFKNQVAEKETLVSKLTDSIAVLKKTGASSETLMVVEGKLTGAVEDLMNNKKILEQNQTAVNTDFSTVHITEAAYPGIRKDKPVRSLIVIGITLGAFFFMVILAVMTENYRKIKSKVTNA
jgi:capsular polysaccharide biosynthesis protein